MTPSCDPKETVTHASMANAVRTLAIDAVEKAGSGHPGMPMGMADAATVLFTRFLKFDAAAPDWPDRDRFVLSAGHGSMLLYALLYLTGYPGMGIEDLRGFRQLGARTAGHPEHGLAPGVETTTGPLGQGFANAVGMALAERLLAARFGPGIVDHRTYVVASDGDLMEGLSHEAASLAGHLRLGRLVVLYDDNGVTIDGAAGLALADDPGARFAAYGWRAVEADGHDPDSVAAALEAAQDPDRPTLVRCRTTIGFGAPTKAGSAAAHGAPLGAEEAAAARAALGCDAPPFVVPEPVLAAWRAAGRRGRVARHAWEERREADGGGEFDRLMAGRLPEGWRRTLAAVRDAARAEAPRRATRHSSARALDALTRAIPELVGGSADLTDSNGTRPAGAKAVAAGDFSGRYVHYGVREHAMAAAMTGMALHRGVIPYGGTFLAFSDYMRPALRLAALMGQRVVFVFTHDSIGLGEDGPTHQPVEHLASLRAIPGLRVFRPADAVETAECWELALERADGPSMLALTRQAAPALRSGPAGENLAARGGYVLAGPEAGGAARAALLATGSEVAVALAARGILEAEGVATQVASLPCWEIFDLQDDEYRERVLGAGAVRVGVEAATGTGWDRYLGPRGAFVGMTGFGASAPAAALYEHFGLTAEAVAGAARALLAA